MATLQVLKINSSGQRVKDWQNFLIGQGFDPGVVDGVFGEPTKQATIEFQKKTGLQPDGIVGNKTFGAAMQLGFEGVTDTDDSRESANFPPEPDFRALSDSKREALFEHFDFVPDPIPSSKENIKILGNWEGRNIVSLNVPQLIPINVNRPVRFHRFGANQFMKLWSDWEAAGLLSRVLTWDGSFVPRFQRGSTTKLSNHAFGSAFDINAEFNPMGIIPPSVGREGSVRELVEIANANGFFWGGHFKKRKDGMHFEIAKLM